MEQFIESIRNLFDKEDDYLEAIKYLFDEEGEREATQGRANRRTATRSCLVGRI
jgi:hypothetical protein